MPSKITYVVSELIEYGIATVGVGFPATPLVEGRIRFCISASHTKEMLDKVSKEYLEIFVFVIYYLYLIQQAVELMGKIGGDVCARSSKLPKFQGEIAYETAESE